MSNKSRHLYEFGAFRIDATERLLIRDGESVPLTPKAFDTLLALVENSGHVLGKEELIEKVWPDSFVEENNLAQNISMLRKVLGAGAGGHPYIETIPRRGYRFVADVREFWDERAELILREQTRAHIIQEETIEEAPAGVNSAIALTGDASGEHLEGGAHNPPTLLEAHTTSSPPSLSTPSSFIERHKRSALAALAGLVIAVAATGYFAFLRQPRTARASAETRSLAILPFRNLRPDPQTDFLGFSLADAIITKLGYVSALTVRPSSYVDKYRNQTIDPQKVAAELNVDTLLTGLFLKDGDDLRITAQLIDVKTNRTLWQDTINLKYEKLLTVQDEVAQQIVKGLELKLSPVEAERLEREAPIEPLAYEYYLRGVDLYSMNNFPMAIRMLEKSAELEPNYALTWAELGRAYEANASLQFGGQEQYRRAESAYEKALALNPLQIEPRVYLANFFTDTGKVEEAVPLLRAALETNPNHAEAHWELGYAYRFAGMLRESVAECERARQLDPEVKLNSSAMNSYLYLGEYDKFIASLPAKDDSAFILFYRGFGEYHRKNWEEAARDFERAYAIDPTLFQAQIGKALSEGLAHQETKGIELLNMTRERIEELGVSDAEGIYKVAEAYAVLGDKSSALGMLRRSIEGGFFCYPYMMRDPLLDSLRDEAEFAQLMEEARQRHEQFKRRFF